MWLRLHEQRQLRNPYRRLRHRPEMPLQHQRHMVPLDPVDRPGQRHADSGSDPSTLGCPQAIRLANCRASSRLTSPRASACSVSGLRNPSKPMTISAANSSNSVTRLGRRQRKEVFDQRDLGRLNRYNRRTAAKLVQPRFQIFDRIIRRQLEWRLQRAVKPHPAGQGGNECMVLFHQPFDRLAHLCPDTGRAAANAPPSASTHLQGAEQSKSRNA